MIQYKLKRLVSHAKKNPSNHYDIDMLLIRKNTQKLLELYLDTKLNFFEHINEKKAVKGINVIKKLNGTLLPSSLLTIFKSFIRPHLDYGDVIKREVVSGIRP